MTFLTLIFVIELIYRYCNLNLDYVGKNVKTRVRIKLELNQNYLKTANSNNLKKNFTDLL